MLVLPSLHGLALQQTRRVPLNTDLETAGLARRDHRLPALAHGELGRTAYCRHCFASKGTPPAPKSPPH
ncbi:hypothetical protein PHAMO_270024 [Magnetospirillum molischianum DSM 120]|uniref:Uncharacterized protein n=1 Tax=Magnetospirillum molischianum DSM 120 TaxID=1150626 RepID=H8FS45_MAGML|nr:hypothetical protein PHAMO_270024 [Magnetospirillum molischianum DSM 120]